MWETKTEDICDNFLIVTSNQIRFNQGQTFIYYQNNHYVLSGPRQMSDSFIAFFIPLSVDRTSQPELLHLLNGQLTNIAHLHTAKNSIFLKPYNKYKYIFSRHGRSQGLLYKHLSHLLIPTALQRCNDQKVRDRASSYKIVYVIVIKNFINHKGHQNPISDSKVKAILLK